MGDVWPLIHRHPNLVADALSSLTIFIVFQSYTAMIDDNNPINEIQRVKVTLNLKASTIEVTDALKQAYGAQSRSRTLEMLIEDLLSGD